MKKFIYLLPFGLSFCCLISFNIIGSEVAPDGTLVEPFFLIPIAYIFLFIGIISVSIKGIYSLYKKHAKA
ncbi:DUF3955 domain-containing protein [Clostridium sardiniense]|uniref:DUF3955 domain-containing protein n=1 Tax=Clostridium sardiniense TaxID=29369 RepID=A0ABS7KU93_CLOSR|nr:DUF3955 domain-containing protein [Clostridium sardiniense]MBY0754158.1 DUF3955 domain-containing protein [Clostridium sardiniense]MDQ0459316.1 hypothetical protein [Clostridium sardiniense]